MTALRRHAALGCALLGGLMTVAGCGGSSTKSASAPSTSSSPATTATAEAPPASPATAQRPNEASIAVESGIGNGRGGISSRYTCRGADISPSIEWASVPSSAKELLIVVRTLSRGSLITNWSVAGLSPSLDELRAGKLPAGAVVGRNSFGQVGYHLCPKKRVQALVVLGVYAVPSSLHLHSGFGEGPIIEAAGSPSVAWGSTSILVGGRPVKAQAG